ncbi:MAG: hypothetical protein EOP87_00900 [Verrucomicrobiaceae bacterium]|nr:MAG: hypothetical protein EOP87_00900 [Verrucomicrobiaceae bacterium]
MSVPSEIVAALGPVTVSVKMPVVQESGTVGRHHPVGTGAPLLLGGRPVEWMLRPLPPTGVAPSAWVAGTSSSLLRIAEVSEKSSPLPTRITAPVRGCITVPSCT